MLATVKPMIALQPRLSFSGTHWEYLFDLSIRADDESQPVCKLSHKGDVELRAIQVGNVRANVRKKRELQAVGLLEVEVLPNV